QRLLASECGREHMRNDVDGHMINMITQVGGGDEVWFNAGDNRFYVTSTDSTGQTVLGVIDAETSTWIQNVPAPGVRNVAAFAGSNHIFDSVSAPASSSPPASLCWPFGL